MKKIIFVSVISLLLFSCSSDEQDEDVVNNVPKDGAVESTIKVEHLNDSLDILVTDYKIWKNGNTIKSGQLNDTIPSLGFKEVYDENNNKKTVKIDYDVFISVK